MTTDQPTQQELLLNPLYLFSEELKEKTLKKSSIQGIATIALALGPKKTREDLLPFLSITFVKESQQNKILILKNLPNLLPFIGKNHNACSILEIVIDILCVFSEKDVRKEAFICLDKVLSFIDIRKAQKSLISTLKMLNQETNQNIRELVIKIIPKIYIAFDLENQKDLLALLQSFKESEADKILLSTELPQIVKVMPPVPEKEVRSIMQLLLKVPNSKVKINLIESICLLTKILGQEITSVYLKQLIADEDNENVDVFCALFKKIKDLKELFSIENLQQILKKVQNYKNQNHDIKNSILSVLEHLVLSQEEKQELFSVPQSLQLKNTLSESLCRMGQIEVLLKVIDASDLDFKIKIFPKLPTASQIHIAVLDSVLNGKNWRVKLTILQNIDKRLENNQKIEIFLPKLSEYLGDKIAIVRSTIGSLLSKIILRKDVPFDLYSRFLIEGLKGQNWLLRQSVYMMTLNLVKGKKGSDKAELKYLWKLVVIDYGLSQKIVNIASVIDEIIDVYREKYYQLVCPFEETLEIRGKQIAE